MSDSNASIRHIFGNINANGSIRSGSGDFDVVPEGHNSGEFTIVFRPPFNSIPSIVATQCFPNWDDFSSNGGSTLDNVTIIGLDQRKAKLKTGDHKGNGADRNISFIAIG